LGSPKKQEEDDKWAGMPIVLRAPPDILEHIRSKRHYRHFMGMASFKFSADFESALRWLDLSVAEHLNDAKGFISFGNHFNNQRMSFDINILEGCREKLLLPYEEILILAADYASVCTSAGLEQMDAKQFEHLARTRLGMTHTRACNALFSKISPQGRPFLSLRRYIGAMHKVLTLMEGDDGSCRNQPATHKFIFDLYDSDGGGTISHEELQSFLSEEGCVGLENMYEVVSLGQAVVKWMDYDGDGEISLQDYVTACERIPFLTACFQNVCPIYECREDDDLHKLNMTWAKLALLWKHGRKTSPTSDFNMTRFDAAGLFSHCSRAS
jgi:Ca2+-binding EF-hand superfamily protein